MEIGKEKQLVENFLDGRMTMTALWRDLIKFILEVFLRWLRGEGFEIISFMVDHDDYIEQSRKHFALEGCKLGGRSLEAVPAKVQGGKDSKSSKAKRRGDKKNV